MRQVVSECKTSMLANRYWTQRRWSNYSIIDCAGNVIAVDYTCAVHEFSYNIHSDSCTSVVQVIVWKAGSGVSAQGCHEIVSFRSCTNIPNSPVTWCFTSCDYFHDQLIWIGSIRSLLAWSSYLPLTEEMPSIVGCKILLVLVWGNLLG